MSLSWLCYNVWDSKKSLAKSLSRLFFLAWQLKGPYWKTIHVKEIWGASSNWRQPPVNIQQKKPGSFVLQTNATNNLCDLVYGFFLSQSSRWEHRTADTLIAALQKVLITCDQILIRENYGIIVYCFIPLHLWIFVMQQKKTSTIICYWTNNISLWGQVRLFWKINLSEDDVFQLNL